VVPSGRVPYESGTLGARTTRRGVGRASTIADQEAADTTSKSR